MKEIILKKQGGKKSLLTDKESQNGGNFSIYLLGKKLFKKSYQLKINATSKESNITIHWDNYWQSKKPNNEYLIVREPPCIIPKNHDPENFKNFKKVFTWNEKYINNENIFPLPFAQREDQTILENSGENFCCLISSNKLSFHKDELYSERKKAIKYFEKKYPNKFSLYGYRWNSFFYPFKSNIKSLWRKDFSILKALYYIYVLIFDNYYEVYKGTLDNKLETLSKYKFCICYENQRGVHGYITEKIWDCFFTGSIPIYLGSENIEQYIPKGCFIDKRNFNNYDELYKYMSSLNKKEIKKYQENIDTFLNSTKAKNMYSEHWSNTVIKNILI
ncbi:glycosyltransferase family 10 [Candidatus Gracilibacteria bacterium]|nr:glycosyltransferase family 10 [Candidatus Gracilibacteria bacterium]